MSHVDSCLLYHFCRYFAILCFKDPLQAAFYLVIILSNLFLEFFFCLPGRRHTLDLAASAMAGLASTEDFTKVRLRKTAGPEGKDEYRGTKPIMLIHIKGKR